MLIMASFSELDHMIQNGQGKSHLFAEMLVRNYYDYIYRLAAYILGAPTEADDICQETFIDALLYIDRYSPGTNLKAWLAKIAVHKCQQMLRKWKIRDALSAVIRTRQVDTSKSPTPLESTVEKEGSEQIWAAINALDDKHRILVILYYVNELKVREIADILEIPEGTVSSRLHYAIQNLESRLRLWVE
jgi:RNA polymerase sigma factor (sigma-70 family)